MVRSIWTGSLAGALAWAGLAWAQAGPPAPNTITIQEKGKPPVTCRVLNCWNDTAKGVRVCQVQVESTGEILTLVDPDGKGSPLNDGKGPPRRAVAWGKSGPARAGTLQAPRGPSLFDRIFRSEPQRQTQPAPRESETDTPRARPGAGGKETELASDRARPTDWRLSWGRVDRRQEGGKFGSPQQPRLPQNPAQARPGVGQAPPTSYPPGLASYYAARGEVVGSPDGSPATGPGKSPVVSLRPSANAFTEEAPPEKEERGRGAPPAGMVPPGMRQGMAGMPRQMPPMMPGP